MVAPKSDQRPNSGHILQNNYKKVWANAHKRLFTDQKLDRLDIGCTKSGQGLHENLIRDKTWKNLDKTRPKI